MAFSFSVVAYINGVRFDPSSVTYNAQDGGDYNFSVDVPAVAEWDMLPERSHGAIFFTDPVTKKWRFLCEGEYVSVSKAKSSSGTRSRTLYFRSIFGWWGQATFCSVASLSSPTNVGSDLVGEVIRARANGKNLQFDFSKMSDPSLRIDSLQALISTAFKDAKGIPAFFPLLLRNCALQTPVEAFYMAVRKLDKKVHAFEDKEIESTLDIELFKDVINNGHNSFDLKFTNSLEEIMRKYEDLAFYQRKVLPAPFLIDSQNIMELLWTPQLYTVMPPVCNVIFDAQIIMSNEQRNFLSEPTRIVTQVKLPLVAGSNELPFVYMSNANHAYNITSALPDPTVTNPAQALTHDMLSTEEMIKGVIVSPVALGLEKVLNNKATGTGAKLEEYIQQACRHQFYVEKIRARNSSLTCVFLPYLAAGFPCLVEDQAGPYFGIVNSLSHTMSSKSPPTTSVNLSHVRAAYVQQGNDRTPVQPPWLSKMYLHSNIESTYTQVLGILPSNIENKSNPSRGFTSIEQGAGHTDMDQAASFIVAVPQYSLDLEKIADGYDQETVSSKLAKKPDAATAYYQFQYREGITLSQYAEFNNVNSNNVTDVYALLNAGLPVDLSPYTSQANKIYGYPNGLKFVGTSVGDGSLDSNSDIFGVYEVVGGINFTRQTAARTIAAAIAKGIATH